MQNTHFDRNRVVFINLTEMREYNGYEHNLRGGGSFIEQHGYGYEIFNFQNDHGKCYGYAPPYGKVNLSRISQAVNHDTQGDYIDDVFVVFTCSRESIGRLVCGWYQHARIYANPAKDERDSRRFEINGTQICASYNIICNADDATLIDYDDRIKELPHSKRNHGIGHGQNSVWYVDEPSRRALKDDILDYVERNICDQLSSSDEYRHHQHDESKTIITSTKQISRSQEAKAECIRLKGCYCNICGFDFEKEYGTLGRNFIEVHHITPIGKLSTAEGYEGTDPKKDLIPLCSNCHSMIHRRKNPYQPDEIKALLCNK